MRRRGLPTLVLALLVLSGCWLQPGTDPRRPSYNPLEQALTTATVSGLTLLWSADLDGPTRAAGPVNAPIVLYDRVFATTENGLAARVSAASGGIVWHRELGDPSLPDLIPYLDDPAWRDNQVLFPLNVYSYGTIQVLDATTGADVGGGLSQGNVADLSFPDGGTAVRQGTARPGLYLTKVLWTFVAGELDGAGSNSSDYAIVGDRILWPHGNVARGFSAACPRYPGDTDGVIGCAPDWAVTLGGASADPAGVGPGRVVFADAAGGVRVLDTATGALLWQGDVGSPVRTRPMVGDGALVVATDDGRLVAFAAEGCGATTCPALWQTDIGAAPATGPAGGGGVVYVGTSTGNLVAAALHGCGSATCPALATVAAGSPISGGPIVDGGRVIAGTQDGHLVAFGLAG